MTPTMPIRMSAPTPIAAHMPIELFFSTGMSGTSDSPVGKTVRGGGAGAWTGSMTYLTPFQLDQVSPFHCGLRSCFVVDSCCVMVWRLDRCPPVAPEDSETGVAAGYPGGVSL